MNGIVMTLLIISGFVCTLFIGLIYHRYHYSLFVFCIGMLPILVVVNCMFLCKSLWIWSIGSIVNVLCVVIVGR